MSFDIKAQDWDADPAKVERAKIYAELVSKFAIGKGLEKALEFGCGTGLVSFFLKDDFLNITLADTSKGMIEVLKNKITVAGASHFTPILIDENTIFESESFDITYSLLTMHHVKDLDKAFLQFHNLLKQEGYLCIADLVKEDGDFHNAEDTKHVHHGFDKEPLIQKLNDQGFQLIDYQIYHHIERTMESGIIKIFPLFLVIAQK